MVYQPFISLSQTSVIDDSDSNEEIMLPKIPNPNKKRKTSQSGGNLNQSQSSNGNGTEGAIWSSRSYLGNPPQTRPIPDENGTEGAVGSSYRHWVNPSQTQPIPDENGTASGYNFFPPSGAFAVPWTPSREASGPEVITPPDRTATEERRQMFPCPQNRITQSGGQFNPHTQPQYHRVGMAQDIPHYGTTFPNLWKRIGDEQAMNTFVASLSEVQKVQFLLHCSVKP